MIYYHGGVPGMKVGQIIEPGHDRRHHDGCPYCEARAKGEAHYGLDPLAADRERVYFTTDRLYAKFYASLWGYGDLYRVTPKGEVLRSEEDNVPSFRSPTVTVAAVLDRAVRLTQSERRRLWREWGAADVAAHA